MSRPYLSAKFSREAGISLTDFILKQKTEEAKRLLCCSDKSAASNKFLPRFLIAEPFLKGVQKVLR